MALPLVAELRDDTADEPATPPPAPMTMPTQSLEESPAAEFDPPELTTRLARIITFGGAAALTVFGVYQMNMVFGSADRSPLEWLLLIMFTITFGWIALSATQAVVAPFCLSRRHRKDRATPLRSRTAIVMPVYNEEPTETAAAIYAIGDGLATLGHGDHFEIFLLSDTRVADVFVKETAAFAWLREELAGRMKVWYRRRWLNAGRKAGNLRDFIENWGGRYDYMLVLDADSLMSPGAIAEMVRRMDAAPRLGLLQSVPTLIGGETLFARLQAFAGRLYGPIIAQGVSAWQGVDGNYWGHNALIRVEAFAANCGLPELPGRMPFGGHVLSHDFVEAALMRRAGWEVRMDPDLTGSWEGSPPSLLDLAARDRRWAQGNLQHSAIVGAKGLRLPNRIHFLTGIGAYLMSPAWLLLLLVGAALTAQSLIFRPEYFTEALQLFPKWPVFDAQRMAWLFAGAMALLLLPKIAGLVRALAIGRIRRSFGGPAPLIASALVEVVISALYAPILMFMQARHVWEIFSGADSGWASQHRTGALMPWRAALRTHYGHMLWGLVPLALLIWQVPEQVVWVAPVVAGLAIAPVLSRASGDPRLGALLDSIGLLATPEARDPPRTIRVAEAARGKAAAATKVALTAALRDRAALERHVAALSETDEAALTETQRLDRITARAKAEAAANPEQAIAWMTPAERATLLASPDLLRDVAAKWSGTAPEDEGRD